MNNTLDGLIWLPVTLVLLILSQRWLHRELQDILYTLTKRPTLTVGLFSLLFFPGVLLHELSHYLAARLLSVRTGGFSLLPRILPDGKLRLGYVETAPTDAIRDTLIGAAPLISGLAAVYLIGYYALGIPPFAISQSPNIWSLTWQAWISTPQVPDFWLWFYLALTISSTMFPSASDRRGWLPVTITILLMFGLTVLIGAGPWMITNLGPGLNQFFRLLSIIFSISLALHLSIAIPAWLLRLAITKNLPHKDQN